MPNLRLMIKVKAVFHESLGVPMSRLLIGFATFATVSCGLTVPAFAEAENINPPTQTYAGPIIGFDSVVAGDDYGASSGNGVTYGGVLGVSAPTGAHARVGLEAEVDGSSASRRGTFDGYTGKLSAGRDLFIGARLGYMIAPRVETFFKAGYTNAHFSVHGTDASGDKASYGQNFGGFRVGAGVGLSLDKVQFRLEYRFSDYGKLKIDGYDTGVTGTRHQVVLGATYPL